LKQVLVLLAILFVVVLAIVVGQRLSTEAMAVVVGVVCGVIASVPVSLGLLLLLGRLPTQRESEVARETHRASPPVVVVTSGGPPGLSYSSPTPWPLNRMPGQERTFYIIGEDTIRLPPEGKPTLDIEGNAG